MLIFAGTTEGRLLCERLDSEKSVYTVCVATEYGKLLLEGQNPNRTVLQGRLDESQMARIIKMGETVIDATHPYAAQVSQNIRAACQCAQASYIRVLREAQSAQGAQVIRVPDTQRAVAYLNDSHEKALLGVGAKELASYTAVRHFASRLYPRVLPMVESVQICHNLGFAPAHIIAMQGPFSHELNVALLRSTGATIFVTKDTGEAGGFAQKHSAAQAVGGTLLVIDRPGIEQGVSLDRLWEKLKHENTM